MATALVLPLGFIATQGVASAAGGTTCKHSSGSATFKPALPKVGSGTTVKPKVIVKKATTTGCTGGGVTSGAITSVTKFHDPTSCDILLGGGPPGPHPPTGTLTTTWNTGTTSVANVTLNPVTDQPTQTHITGTIASGTFSGKHLDQTISFTPKKGDCVSTDLVSVTFKEVTALKIS